MADILLIPGYATELRVSFLRRPRSDEAGFFAFRAAVRDGKAKALRWGIAETIPFSRIASIAAYRELYWRERERASGAAAAEQLFQLLEQEKPSTIVCHSLGAHLLVSAMRRYELPPSVKRVVLVQADIAETEAVTRGLASVKIQNLYCRWDPSLAISAVYHHGWRAGQVGWRLPGVENIRMALWRPINLHTSSIRDPRLAQFAAR